MKRATNLIVVANATNVPEQDHYSMMGFYQGIQRGKTKL